LFATNIVTAVDVMKTIEKPLSLGVHMSNNLDEILSLTKEITYQDGDDFDITVTEYGEELSKTKDIEFLWIARNTSSTVKKASTNIKSFNSLAVAQLHHAGMRSPEDIIGERPVCPSSDDETNSRALTLDEVKKLRDDFISAAFRAKKSGYDGVEIHGAHGYILCQFLSSSINNRKDEYGGSLENRSRIIFEIIDGIRNECGKSFLLGVRLSPERFGMDLEEIKTVCKQLIETNKIDFLDISF